MEKKLDVSSPNEVFFGDYLRSSETDEVSSKSTSSDSSEMQENPKTTSHWRGLVELLRIKSMKPLATLHPLSVLKLSRRESKSVRENGALASNAFGDNYSSEYFTSGWNNFTLAELQNATRNFSHENLVGKGGYAEVYKGCIRGGKLVAVKRLTRGTAEESTGDFLSELGIMAHVNHPNTARLIGYGVEGGMHIVLEFSPHGSLASLLHCETGSKEKLDWSIRYKVALGTAEGLLYLHEGCKRRIIHRDIKAANILLTENFEPQICDFGLAKWLPEQWTHHTVSKFEGTFGYLAPEYLMHGIVDEKTDVFAFGVLLLELITGRRALDYSQQSLVLWAKPLLYKNKVKELVDPSLDGDYNSQQMNLAVLATSLCIKRSSIRRPRMSQVVQILKGNLSNLDCKRIRRMPCYQKALCKEHFDTEEYYSAEDFNDLNRHKQLALGF